MTVNAEKMNNAVITDIYDEIYRELFSDVDDGQSYPNKRPLLAHYTSIAALENIIKDGELWFSNPLFMNDLEEVRFGMNEGAAKFEGVVLREACETEERWKELDGRFEQYFLRFANENVMDIYAFCTCEHDSDKEDGLLSMWRGYGGNGKGVAIVFDTAKLNPIGDFPFVMSKVIYASQKQRIDWIESLMARFAEMIARRKPPTELLYLFAHALVERLKLFSIFTKHDGFREEREWRVVYLPDRDKKKAYKDACGYLVGANGAEPKLKLKLESIPRNDGVASYTELINKIILGPSLSTNLAQRAIIRMLAHLKRPELRDRVVASTIPFRVAN